MTRTAAYRILDEPQPGRLSQFVVDPMWPLFALMFGGAWFSWIWFVVNGQALGSPTRVREPLLALAGFMGVIVLSGIIVWLLGTGTLPEDKLRYAALLVTLWKLAVCYWLYSLQSRSFDVYEYYGGSVRNGFVFVIVGYFIQGSALQLSTNFIWRVLVT
jgi:hypothetical protein